MTTTRNLRDADVDAVHAHLMGMTPPAVTSPPEPLCGGADPMDTATLILAAFHAVEEMRGWLVDCGADPDITYAVSDREVIAEVERQYDGGVRGFLADSF